MENHIITSRLYEVIKLQESNYGSTMKMTDVEIASLFKT